MFTTLLGLLVAGSSTGSLIQWPFE